MLEDPTKVTGSATFFYESYTALAHSELGFALLFGLCVALFVLLLLATRGSLATYLNVLGGAWNTFWGKRKMAKDRAATIKCDSKQNIMDWIDDQQEAGKISQYEANDLYRLYSSIHPDLRCCIEPVKPADAVVEEMKGSKDGNGAIIPVPIPG